MNAVLIEPLPYPEADRLVVVWKRNTAVGKDRDPVAPLNSRDWRARNTTFDELGAYQVESAALSGIEPPEHIVALAMSSSVFRVLDVESRWGRTFTEEEEQERARVVVLNDHFWRRRFGADTGVIGQAMTLDGEAFTVVGVMPPEFAFPDGYPADGQDRRGEHRSHGPPVHAGRGAVHQRRLWIDAGARRVEAGRESCRG